MNKLINETLKVNGKWSIKRIAGISGFYAGIFYAFMPIFVKSFQVFEFVFIGFLSFGATAIGMTVWNKYKNPENP
jgi:hypothetical protein